MPNLSLNFIQKITQGYPIVIEPSILNRSQTLNRYITQKQVCIVSNETVAPLYLAQVREALGAKQVVDVVLPDGEQYKNLVYYAQVFDVLLANQFGRDCVVVALGGGVVGDLAGFVAATYQRGVAFVYLPTTLLAQVDASVGGKTGVNHVLGKNMIGAFHQPQAVLIDTHVLETLPAREFSAGLAEVIKYGLINDVDFFIWLENHIDLLMAKNENFLNQVIRHCCQNKAKIVQADEREEGQRALLNLGHTFAHALESLSHYQRWKHGEAVAIGIRMAAELAYIRDDLSMNERSRIIRLLERAHLPVDMASCFDVHAVYEAMFLDKKVRDQRLHLVVLTQLGQCRLADDIAADDICAAIRAGQGN